MRPVEDSTDTDSNRKSGGCRNSVIPCGVFALSFWRSQGRLDYTCDEVATALDGAVVAIECALSMWLAVLPLALIPLTVDVGVHAVAALDRFLGSHHM